MGGIRVDRTSGSDEPLEHAAAALQSGEMVALMPQGTIPRGLEFFNPQLQGRWGAARLAVQTNATVIPIGLWGTEKVWPRNAKLPDVLNLSNPPLVSITVGASVELDRSGNSDEIIAANTHAIMNAISALLPAESRELRAPTDAELRATFPSSYSGDLRADTSRRPGTDPFVGFFINAMIAPTHASVKTPKAINPISTDPFNDSMSPTNKYDNTQKKHELPQIHTVGSAQMAPLSLGSITTTKRNQQTVEQRSQLIRTYRRKTND